MKKNTHAYESEREEIGHSTWQNLSSLLFTLPSVRSIETNHKSHSVVDIPSPSLHLHFLFFFKKKKKRKEKKRRENVRRHELYPLNCKLLWFTYPI
jgi:predicted ATP-dependent endonuclease of OLD family